MGASTIMPTLDLSQFFGGPRRDTTVLDMSRFLDQTVPEDFLPAEDPEDPQLEPDPNPIDPSAPIMQPAGDGPSLDMSQFVGGSEAPTEAPERTLDLSAFIDSQEPVEALDAAGKPFIARPGKGDIRRGEEPEVDQPNVLEQILQTPFTPETFGIDVKPDKDADELRETALNAAKAFTEAGFASVELPRKLISGDIDDKLAVVAELDALLPSLVNRPDLRSKMGELLAVTFYDPIAGLLGDEEAQQRVIETGGTGPILSLLMALGPKILKRASTTRAARALVKEGTAAVAEGGLGGPRFTPVEVAANAAQVEFGAFTELFESFQAPEGFRPPKKTTRKDLRRQFREEGLRGKELTERVDASFLEAATEEGIALRQTKGGKQTPSVRQAGTFVPEEFVQYKNFKDAKEGVLGKDVTRFVQEIDGALSVEAKAKLPGQAGPAEQGVLFRTRDMVKSKIKWQDAAKDRLAAASEGVTPEMAETANQLLVRISERDIGINPVELAKRPSISQITTDPVIIRYAQEGRRMLDDLLGQQNIARTQRDQPPIPRREFYTPEEIHRTTIWERALGKDKGPEIVRGPGVPDYIQPNAPFNPRAKAREVGLPETALEMNLTTLLENYIETAGKDIYNTSIIQNNKAFIQQLESMGLKNAADGLANWTSDAFAGVPSAIDRASKLSPGVFRAMGAWRGGLARSVFPLNLAWNTTVQTSSAVLTYARYGLRDSFRGGLDWFGNAAARKEIRSNAYSAIIKDQKSGKVTRQDVGGSGATSGRRLNEGLLENASDAANMFTETIERNLTGWSIASAKRAGARKGLKGKALWEFASDGGAKTQSMYNMEDLPRMLRSEVVKTAAPFQTFSFELYNTMKEIAGKTGTPPETFKQRAGFVTRLVAGATAVNYMTQAATGRKPWEFSSFIPFYGSFVKPGLTALTGGDVGKVSQRGLPGPISMAAEAGSALSKAVVKPGIEAVRTLIDTKDFNEAVEEYIATAETAKLRKFVTKYVTGLVGIPAGTQIDRVVDGIMIEAENDNFPFEVSGSKDRIRSFLAGPWSTTGGQDFWRERGNEIELDIKWFDEHPEARRVVESIPIVSDAFRIFKP